MIKNVFKESDLKTTDKRAVWKRALSGDDSAIVVVVGGGGGTTTASTDKLSTKDSVLICKC